MGRFRFRPIRALALSSSDWRRPVMKTYAPSSTNFFAVANPIPLLPPVMTATFPFSFDIFEPLACEGRAASVRARLRCQCGDREGFPEVSGEE